MSKKAEVKGGAVKSKKTGREWGKDTHTHTHTLEVKFKILYFLRKTAKTLGLHSGTWARTECHAGVSF